MGFKGIFACDMSLRESRKVLRVSKGLRNVLEVFWALIVMCNVSRRGSREQVRGP